MKRKGIILAGGSGSRLYPVTQSISKQLLPVYDKPMIYYPLTTLMLGDIREILIISTPQDLPKFKKLFGDGSQWGLSLSYKTQPTPDGIAQSFILGEDFIGDDDVCMILGDNIFNGDNFSQLLSRASKNVSENKIATVFGYPVSDPSRYGVIEFDKSGSAISIEEKPKNPKSNYAVTGLYFYPNSVVNLAKKIKPSERGELEITSINQEYLKNSELKVELMQRGFAWLDTGTHESLIEASNYIKMIENRQGIKVACIEEVAYQMGYISKNNLLDLAKPLVGVSYGEYLIQRANEL